MNHLSGIDAAFLYLETPEMPMHVGSLNLYDLPAGYQGDFYDFDIYGTYSFTKNFAAQGGYRTLDASYIGPSPTITAGSPSTTQKTSS